MFNLNLPCGECKGQCCTYPVFSSAEMQIVRITHGVPREANVTPIQHEQSYDPKVKKGDVAFMVALPNGFCPYLKEGKCSIYNVRPKVCKDYGTVPDLPCQYLYPKLAEEKQNERIKRSRL